MFKRIMCVLVFLVMISAVFAGSIETTIDINASSVVNTFKPYNVFGNNLNGWSNPTDAKDKIEAAGNFILRYPGGSWGDGFFWNSAGAPDKSGNWVPSDKTYENSTNGDLNFGPDRIGDGDAATEWRSNAETDFPDSQWVYVDLKAKKMPEKVEITWGNAAYAKKFTVQYWDPAYNRQWMVYDAEDNAWKNTTAVDVAGNTATQEIKFTPVESQYVRILMKKSSEGKGGIYSVNNIKVYSDGAEVATDKGSFVASSSDTAATPGNGASWVFGFEKFMTFINSFETIKPSPLIIVNLGSGTPQMAAAWVKYANKTKGYGIKYWEIGNESGGQWEVGGPMNVYDYARRYIKFYEAMKAVDPTITIIAQGQADGFSGTYDHVPAITALINRLAKEKKESYVEGLVTHQYKTWDQKVEDLLAVQGKEMKETADKVKSALAKYPKLKDTPIWFTEFNTSDHVKPHDISVRFDEALWMAQYVPEFIVQFGSRGYMTMWDCMNGGSAINEEFGGDHGYLQAEDGPYKWQERSTYWLMKMFTNYWTKSGDLNDHKLVATAAGSNMISAYTDLKPDGSMAVLVVNKDPENEFKTTLTLSGFTPAEKARVYTFDRSNYDWSTSSKPYHASPDNPPSESETNVAGKFTYTFKPYSITVIVFGKIVER